MKITICIGSSCHIKGSRQVVEQLQALVSERGLMDRIELAGTFCIGQCQSGSGRGSGSYQGSAAGGSIHEHLWQYSAGRFRNLRWKCFPE